MPPEPSASSKSATRQRRAIGPPALRLETFDDPRCWKCHPRVAAVLVACSAAVTGAKPFTAIGQHAREATARSPRLGPRTLRRSHCPGRFADLLARDPAEADTLAVRSRGTRHRYAPRHSNLLAAMSGSAQADTQLRVPDETNESPAPPIREDAGESAAPEIVRST